MGCGSITKERCFDTESKMREFIEAWPLPEGVEPVVVLAIGTVAHPEQLESPLREREESPRERRPLEDIVISGLD